MMVVLQSQTEVVVMWSWWKVSEHHFSRVEQCKTLSTIICMLLRQFGDLCIGIKTCSLMTCSDLPFSKCH